jgi:hypothetical protein
MGQILRKVTIDHSIKYYTSIRIWKFEHEVDMTMSWSDDGVNGIKQ